MIDFGLTIFAFIVLLSVLIFVHELGHFLAAKACGVRVLKFSIGFGHPIRIGRFRAHFERGGTEYVVAWFPLGGFVKMLGENPDEEVNDPEVHAHPDETLGSKPLWQKLLIIFAGPAMNLALPVVIFALMLATGVPRADSVVGIVETGSPAEAAGLAPGDRITELGGEPVRWWGEVMERLRGSAGERIEVAYERGGEGQATALSVEARQGLDAFGQVADIGWAGLGHPRPRALLGVRGRAAPAWQAGLRSGDRVVSVDGAPVEDWYEFEAVFAAARGDAVALEVARGNGEEERRESVHVPAAGSAEALGVFRASALVTAVEPGSPADRAGIEAGDLILELDGRPVTFFDTFAQTVSTSGGRPMPLTVVRRGETIDVTIAAEPLQTDLGFGIEEPRYRIGIMGSNALLPGSSTLDRETNPLVAVPRAAGMTLEFTRSFLQGFGKIVTGEVSRKSLAGPIGIAQMAGAAFQEGWERYLRLMILISINLGILNLLPIPVLDGGQGLLFIVESIKRSPLSLRTKLAVQQLGVTVIVLLMGLAFWNDLSRLWSKVVDWLPGGL